MSTELCYTVSVYQNAKKLGEISLAVHGGPECLTWEAIAVALEGFFSRIAGRPDGSDTALSIIIKPSTSAAHAAIKPQATACVEKVIPLSDGSDLASEAWEKYCGQN